MPVPDESDCYGDLIVCPYCGHHHRDSWEYTGEDGDIDCEHCSRLFRYSRMVSVTYSSTPIIGPHKLSKFEIEQEKLKEEDA